MVDMPMMTASSYVTRSIGGGSLLAVGGPSATDIEGWSHTEPEGWLRKQEEAAKYRAHLVGERRINATAGTSQTVTSQPETNMAANGKGKLRVVRVFLVDPDERIPMEKRILHRSDEITTDATDQELFFSIPVQDLLKSHNALRTSIKWKDEGSKGEPEPLKEIRIRDLVMSVTTVAEFAIR